MLLKSGLFVFLIAVATLGISSFAASVNVVRTTHQADYGTLIYVYFETISGPGSVVPSANTAQTPSSSSGNYRVLKGSSAYLWTPQFTSSATLGQGSWVLDFWASCTSSSTISISIYTTTSTGTVQSTILSSGTTSIVPTSETQIVNTFSGSLGAVPPNGYISLVLSVPILGPRHCVIYWGTAQETNFQVPYRILST